MSQPVPAPAVAVLPPSAPLASTPVVAPAKARRAPYPRSWQLHPDSPFHLVAEGLREARIWRLGDATVVATIPCTPAAETQGSRLTKLSFELRAVAGDEFAEQAAPPSPLLESERNAGFSGTWPNDVWLSLPGARSERPYTFPDEGALLHFDGRAWREAFPPAERSHPSQHPFTTLPWFDGATLLATTFSDPRRGAFVLPFRVLGQSTHAAPDFTKLPFPVEDTDLPDVHTAYAALSTHEIFLLHDSLQRRRGKTIVSLARSNQEGVVSLDTLMVASSVSGSLLSGKLGDKEVMLAWGEATRAGRNVPWLKLYDAASAIDLGPGLALPVSTDFLNSVWFAAGQLWAQRGNSVLRFAEGRWLPHGNARPYAKLQPVAQTGVLWGSELHEVYYLDEAGARHDVPWLAQPDKNLFIVGVAPVAPDDVWLVAHQEPDEYLLFRSRPMRWRLGCGPTGATELTDPR